MASVSGTPSHPMHRSPERSPDHPHEQSRHPYAGGGMGTAHCGEPSSGVPSGGRTGESTDGRGGNRGGGAGNHTNEEQMDTKALKAELAAGHPGTGAYNADDALAAAELNVVNRSRNRTAMDGAFLLSATDPTEYAALTDVKQSQWLSLCGVASIDPRNAGIRKIVATIWGGASTTVGNLNTKRVESVSRGVELGFGKVGQGDVEDARNI